MKREEPIIEKDCRVVRNISLLLSVLLLLSIQAVVFGSSGIGSVCDSEMKYLDYGSVINWGLYQSEGEVFDSCDEIQQECEGSVLVSYYQQMWEGVDPDRCRIIGRLADVLSERCPDFSVVLPRANDSQAPGETGLGMRGSSSFLTNRDVRGFGRGHQARNWDRVGRDESYYGEEGIGQVSVTLAALNTGS